MADDLFTPTTTPAAYAVDRLPPWRPGSLVHPAVFGGALAATVLALVNAHRLRLPTGFLGRQPDQPSALAMPGGLAVQRGRIVAAHRSFGQAVAHDPDDPGYAEAARETRLLYCLWSWIFPPLVRRRVRGRWRS